MLAFDTRRYIGQRLGVFNPDGRRVGVPGPERGRGDDAIWLQIVDERGAPWAAPVPIVESGFRGSIVNCSVGNDGAGFLVGWWDGSVLWVRRVDLAL